MFDSDDREDSAGSDSREINGLIPVAIVFFPATIVFYAFVVGLTRKLRLPATSLFQIFIVFEIIVALTWKLSSSTDKIKHALSSLSEIGTTWTSIIFAVILLCFAVGAVAGLTWAQYEIRDLKKNPYKRKMENTWEYNFSFRRTLRQVLVQRKKIEGLKGGVFVDEEKAPLGLNEKFRKIDGHKDDVVFRYNSEARLHTLISGASGSGKSITMQSLIKSDIINDLPTIIIDFKRSPEFASKVATWTKQMGGEFYHFANGNVDDYDIKDSTGPCHYDPLYGGSPTSKADMVLNMREYDTASAVYRSNMQQLLQVLFSMLHFADKEQAPSVRWGQGGVYELASAIAKDNFTELAIACEGTDIEVEAQEVAGQLKGKTPLKHALDELQGQLRTIIASEYGQWMKTGPASRDINLFNLTSKKKNVIMFSLNSDSEPEFAKYVGSMILADITNVSAQRRNKQLDNQVNIYVDEFQAITATSVAGLLEKSRESRMAVTLAQQSFEQVAASAQQNGEAYLLSILDTCSNFIVHSGMTEDSALRLSKILGKDWMPKYRQSDNDKAYTSIFKLQRKNLNITTSEEEDWLCPPQKFMQLTSPSPANGNKSTAVVVNKSCADPLHARKDGAVARRVWMIPDDDVLATYYDTSHRLSPEIIKKNYPKLAKQAATTQKAGKNTGPRASEMETSEQMDAEVDHYDVSQENGDFAFERIDDEPESALEDLDSLENYKSELDNKKQPEKKEDDFLDQWGTPPSPKIKSESKDTPEQALSNPTRSREKEILPKPKPKSSSGLPKSSGLPIPSGRKESKDYTDNNKNTEETNDQKEDKDSISLPDL